MLEPVVEMTMFYAGIHTWVEQMGPEEEEEEG